MRLLIVSIITLSSMINDNKIDLNRLYPNPIIDIKHQQEWQMNLYEERIEQFADEWNITWETEELIDDDGIEII